MLRKSKTPTPDAPDAPTEAQMQQAGRRLTAAHRRLKISFADAYVENTELREEIARLNEVMREQQRVMREMSAKLPKDKPEPKATPRKKAAAKS